jgi:cell division protein FtsB
MKDFQGRRRIRRSWVYQLVIILLVLAVLFMSKALWGVYAKNRLAAAGRAQAERELTELEEQEKELTAKVDWLSTERGQEEEIRKNFAVVRPGEKVITIIDNAGTLTATTSIEAEAGWWGSLVDWIKGIRK